jgi:coatomer protein complex subunit epsilon
MKNVTSAHFQSVYLQGGSKIQEAHLIFQDFSKRYIVTCMILNGKAQCLMHIGNFEQA